MINIARRGVRNLHNVPKDLIEKGQSRVIEASLTLIRERAKLKGELVRALGGAKASASLLGVPLGHNSSFLQGPAFAPPRIREAIWCGSTNASTEEGKELDDPRVLTDVGDVLVQELRDSGIDDDRLMNIISESVKLVMEEVASNSSQNVELLLQESCTDDSRRMANLIMCRISFLGRNRIVVTLTNELLCNELVI